MAACLNEGHLISKIFIGELFVFRTQIEEQKLMELNVRSKVGSLDNVKHKPGGGDKKIFDDKDYLKQIAQSDDNSKANSVTTSGSQVFIS